MFTGTYYSGALFYLSLGLHRIAPESQERAVLLDCDLRFQDDAALLFAEFDKLVLGLPTRKCGFFILMLVLDMMLS